MKPILFTRLIFFLLLSYGCSQKWKKGSVNYSGFVINTCTGQPIANTQLTIWIKYASYGGQGPGFGDYPFGTCYTTKDGFFSFAGAYDLTQVHDKYGVYGIDNYFISIGDEYASGNYSGNFEIITNTKSNITIEGVPSINSLIFTNAKGIVVSDSTPIYISGLEVSPVNTYVSGLYTLSNNDTFIINHGFNYPYKYYATYYRLANNSPKKITDTFVINCNRTVFVLP